jgi:hypothetical protein
MKTCKECHVPAGTIHERWCTRSGRVPAPLPLFDLARGRELRDEGMKKAKERDEGFFDRAYVVGRGLASIQPKVTADDVWGTGLPIPPQGAQALGAVFTQLARDKVIVFPEDGRMVRSKRPSNHATRMRVWVSLIYRPELGATP